MSGGDEVKTDFWSKRKAAVREAEEAERERKEAEAVAGRRAELEEKSDAEILEELGLPDPDTLTCDDDFSAFLAKTVPERLRRRALRKLWGSNPVFANLDGLNDYDEDFTDAALGAQAVRTAYEVGRGFLSRIADDATPESGSESGQPQGPTASAQPDFDALQQEDSAAAQTDLCQFGNTTSRLTQRQLSVQGSGDDTIDSGEIALIDSEEERPAPRRRMKFDYD